MLLGFIYDYNKNFEKFYYGFQYDNTTFILCRNESSPNPYFKQFFIDDDNDDVICIEKSEWEEYFLQLIPFQIDSLPITFRFFTFNDLYKADAENILNDSLKNMENKMEIEFTPENIETLNDNEVFVFGSNLKGRHGAGAAKVAFDNFNAEYGVGEGRTGKCYALPTKGYGMEVLPLAVIEEGIKDFVEYASMQPNLKFYVTKIGCGYAGYTPKDIAPLFFDSYIPENVILPKEFWDIGCGW